MPDQGLVFYPGLQTFTTAEYTNIQGISPGIATIEMPRELVTNLQPKGDLVLTYGDQTVVVPDCIVDFGNIDTSLGGQIVRVTLKDRRWRWQFGEVSGHYNLPAPMPNVVIGNNDAPPGTVGKIRPGTEQAPQALFQFCLDAMGEQNADISQVPNDARPEIHWSHDNPAQQMARLCDMLGCRIVLDLNDAHVIIVPVGQGQPLPDNEFVTFPHEGIQPPVMPSVIRIVGEPTVYQGLIELEAVGLELDGSVRTIDLLTYAPKGGWALEDPLFFPSIQSEPAKTLAHQTVYKWWRPKMPIHTPNGVNISFVYQLVLHDRMLDTYLNFFQQGDPAYITAAPEVIGIFSAHRCQFRVMPKNFFNLYRGSVSIDEERCLVITGDPLYQIGADIGSIITGGGGAVFSPADIRIKTSYSACTLIEREPIRYTRDRQMNTQNQTPPKIIKNEFLCEKIRGKYDDQLALSGFETNGDDGALNAFADFFLDYAQREYVTEDSFIISYARIEPIQLDGIRQQVTYSIVCGEGGSAMTKASSNTEHDPYIPRYRVRRDREGIYETNLKANRWNAAASAQQLAAFEKAQA